MESWHGSRRVACGGMMGRMIAHGASRAGCDRALAPSLSARGPPSRVPSTDVRPTLRRTWGVKSVAATPNTIRRMTRRQIGEGEESGSLRAAAGVTGRLT